MISVEYLEEERKKLWLEINQLKNDLNKKISDHESDAKQASKKHQNIEIEVKNLKKKLLGI